MINKKRVLLFLIIALIPVMGYSQSKKKVIVKKKTINHNLVIQVNVPNYTIWVNNKQIVGNTLSVLPGDYNILVKANGYADWRRSVFVNRNTNVSVNMAKLAEKLYNLSINTNVANSTIYINNQQYSTGGLNTGLPRGNYQVEVRANGYTSYFSNIYLDRNINLVANLQPLGNATVNIVIPSYLLNSSVPNPSNQIKVFDNGQYIPGLSFVATPGNHLIRVESGGFAIEKHYTFNSGQTYTIEPFFDFNIR